MRIKHKLVTAILAGVFAISAQAAPFSNGGFDAYQIKESYKNISDGSYISPWIVTKGSVDISGPSWQADSGTQSIDLLGYAVSVGEIAQTFDTKIGKTYRVNFKMSGNPDGGSPIRILDVSVQGSNIDTFHYEYDVIKNNTTKDKMNWQSHSFDFIASSSATTIFFTATSYMNKLDHYGPALDSVSVTEVNSGGHGGSGECCYPCDKK